jgi:hypothetical protein
MRESAMSPKVAKVDAETKSDCIEVRNNGAQDSGQPNALSNLRSVETGADAQGCDRV